jgi:hypothetical protein
MVLRRILKKEHGSLDSVSWFFPTGMFFKCSALAKKRRGIVDPTHPQAALHPGYQRFPKWKTGATARSFTGRRAGIGALRVGQGGEVEQVGRGLYALPGQSDHALSGDDSFVNSPANNSAHSVGTRLKNSHHMIPILRLL